MAKEIEEQEPSQEPVETETPPETPTEGEPENTPEATVVDPAQELQDKNRQLFERAKKAETENKELRAQIQDTQNQPEPSDIHVDDTPSIEVKELKAQLDSITEKQELDAVYAKYPILKDKLEEFDDFRSEHSRMGVGNAAKVFLVDNDLLNTPEPRQGLEQPTGGPKAPPSSGKMSAEDVERLMDTDFDKYRKLLKEGKIPEKFDDA